MTDIPYHVAIILDGNGRWATSHGKSRSMGHKAGFENLKSLSSYILKTGVSVLSVFAFSTENFKRSEEEVMFLMNLFVDGFKQCESFFNKNNIKVVFSGKENPLSKEVLNSMKRLTEKTKQNDGGILNICINYGGRSGIVETTRKIASKVMNHEIEICDINEDLFSKNLFNDLPPVDLMIRTSGEYRISNFMLWQCAYSEFYFTNTYFPDFDAKEFDKALESYCSRNRRFGGNNNEK